MCAIRFWATASWLILLAACGSSASSDLFDRDGPGGRAGSGGSGPPGVGGFGGVSGAGGRSGAGGSGAVGGSGAGGSGAAGTGGVIGSAGTGGGDAGTAGSSGSGGAGGSQGVGGADAGSGGSAGAGGVDAGSTGGTQGLGGASGTQGVGGAGGSGGTSDPPSCVAKPSQVVLIGDSYVNWITHAFRSDLARLTGETWRSYAMGGASMATGGLSTLIPQQFENAVRADRDIRVVVMDGGGNDILLPAASWRGGSDCKNRMDAPSLPVCRDIVQASLDREQVLMDRMAEVGVRDVVFFFYPVVPNGTVLGGRYPNAIADYARPLARAGCEGAIQRTGGRLRCHFVDMVPVFDGRPQYFATGDIHPNYSGSAAMARTVWETMKSACIAQPEHSGCCKP